MKKICIILGTRPEIIKFSSFIRECQNRKINFFVIHTNQHYSKNLDQIFFNELSLPKPKYNLKIGSGNHADQTGRMLISIDKVIEKEKPDIVLVLGDTNTTLAGALVAAKLHIKVGHIEAGCRSYFREMPEEINRVLVDHVADFLFVSVQKDKDVLLKEGIPEKKIFVTGNTIVDAVYEGLKLAKQKSMILEKLQIKSKAFFLATAHRQENVDNKKSLAGIITGLKLINHKFGLPVIFPVHPRTEKNIKKFKISIPAGLILIEPQGYLDFIKLQSNAKLVLTDSGGAQEECCILNIPCVSLRENTEWPETIEIGSTILVGTNPQSILKGVKKMYNCYGKWKNPFGDGKSAKKVLNILEKLYLRQ